MAKFEVIKPFNDREGKAKYDVNKLPRFAVGDSYESSNAEWTDYLTKEGFLKSTSAKTSTVKEEVKVDEKAETKSTSKKKDKKKSGE